MGFRPMRRIKQQLDQAACQAILERGSAGVLAVAGDDGYPYAVPLSYCYAEGALYFHSARQGHKLDALRRCPKASFCVIDQDRVVAEEYTTYFRSVIAFGRAEILEDPARAAAAMELLAKKYAPLDTAANRAGAIRREPNFVMIRLAVEQLSGKQAIELVRARGR